MNEAKAAVGSDSRMQWILSKHAKFNSVSDQQENDPVKTSSANGPS